MTLPCAYVVYQSLDTYLLSTVHIGQWLSKLLEGFTVYVPLESEGAVHWHRLEPKDLGAGTDSIAPALRRVRTSEPVKSFMFNPRQQVGTFPQSLEPTPRKPRILLGVKSCDIAALNVHDKILDEGEFKDPFYLAQRDSTILVVADCPVPADSCFCNLLGLAPYAGSEADAALSVGDTGWLFQIGGRGRKLIDAAPDLFRRVGDAAPEVSDRDKKRRAAVAALQSVNPKPLNPALPATVAARQGDKAFWNRHAEKCVECFGCLLGCPTCYCFLLYDQARAQEKTNRQERQETGAGFDRTRVWDACYLAAYARVGGGANPRAEFLKRFTNRFLCKFSDFKNDHGTFSCSGCGRCIRACMGKIDIRKALLDL